VKRSLASREFPLGIESLERWSRYDSPTNVSSMFLLSKVNRSTLGCSRNVVIKNLGVEKEDATESAGHCMRVLSPLLTHFTIN
jgi:hypothetical protein